VAGAEAALRQARDALEARVQERTAALARTNEQLQAEIAERARAEREREQLLAREQAAHAEAVAAQHRFRDLVNSIEGIVWEADAQTFQFLFVSQQAERILGYPVERWVSEPAFWKEHLHPDDRAWAVELCVAATAEQRAHDFEYRMLAADGRGVWLRDLVTVVVEQDQATRLRGVIVDITERKQAEAALRERANLLDLTHDTVFVRDMSDVITYWNRGAEELYGWKREEAVGQVSHRLTQTIFPAPLEELNAELLSTGRWDGELAHTKRDGTPVVVASRWSLQRDEQGNPVAILETNNDITERRQAEEALRESEERWRAVFENNPTMYFMVDAAGTILSVNPFGAEQLGYSVNELVGDSVLNVFYEADREAVQRNVATCFEQLGRTMSWEFRKVRKDGTVLWVRETARAMLMQHRPVVLIVCEDITERKRAEEELEKTQQRLRTVIANAPIILFALDRAGVFVLSEGRGLDALGLTPGQLVGQAVFEVYRDVPQMLSNVRRALAGEPLTEVVDVKDLVFETHFIPLLGARGEVAGVNGVAINITERRRAEAKLRESERRYRNIFETAGAPGR
jgi:PAS domain S-box-containing protein